MVCPKCGKEFDGVLCTLCGYAAASESPQSAPAPAASGAASKNVAECPRCGSAVEGNFCTQCGTALTEFDECPVCGAPHKSAERYCGKCGHFFAKPKIVSKEQKQRRKRIFTAVAACLAVVIVLAVVIPVGVVFSSPWHPDNVSAKLEDINIGDTREEVMSVLGTPYGWEEGDNMFNYFSDEYFDVVARLEEAGVDMSGGASLGDIVGALSVLVEAEQTEFQVISVNFDGKGKVAEVIYDAKARLGGVTKKGNFRRATIDTYVYAYENTKLAYSLEFGDGSLYKGTTNVYSEPAEEEVTYPYRYEFRVPHPFDDGEDVRLWTYIYDRAEQE